MNKQIKYPGSDDVTRRRSRENFSTESLDKKTFLKWVYKLSFQKRFMLFLGARMSGFFD